MWTPTCVVILVGVVAAGPVADIDRDFDRAAVQLRLARGEAERLSAQTGAQKPLDIQSVVKGLRNEVHSLREEFDAADSAITKKDDPGQIEDALNKVFPVRVGPEPREPRRPKTDAHAHKTITHPKKSAATRWALAEKARRYPWFKAKQAPRCDRNPIVVSIPKQVAPQRITGPTNLQPMSRAMQNVYKGSMIQQKTFRGAGRRRVAQGEPSISLPGAGGTQKVVEGGAVGSVNGEEPLVRVYKDGYAKVGCYKDSMPEFADKFGNNKDQYKQQSDVSVVWYKQHVLKEKQQPMQPSECYKFCRTVPHMVYFGIWNGDCYCEPYFKPMESGSSACDQACAGNPTEMCGGKDKSSIFEMHFCNNAAEDLRDAATGAGEVLEYFEQQAWTLDKSATLLQDAGAGLQKVAGKGGDPISGDWAQAAKKTAGEWENTLKDGECFQGFNSLQKTYKSVESTMDTDLAMADNLNKADEELFELKTLSETVFNCAKKAEAKNTLAFPWWDKVQTKDGFVQSDHLAEAQLISQTYYPLQYGLNPSTTLSDEDVTMSTCAGEHIGDPMPLWFAECAAACEMTVYPDKCIGFQHYASAGGADEFPPLCILLKEFKTLVEHKCPDASWPELLQEEQKMKGAQNLTDKRMGDLNCFDVKMGIFFSGQSCGRAYGDAFDGCPDECGKAKSFGVSAGCFIRMAELSTGGLPDVETKLNKKCFGGPDNTPGGASSGPGADAPGNAADFSATIKFGSDEAKTTTLWT